MDSGYTLDVEYGYTDDLLTRITTNSTVYTFEYGLFAQSAAIKVGSRTLASYSYTEDQNRYLSALDYGNGDKVQYTYDTYGRLILETYEDGDTVAYTYDNNGALATVTDSATGRKTTYYYDFTDRLMKYTESGTNFYHSVGYEYDSLNNLTSLVEIINGVEHSTTYTYDDDNRVSEIDNDATTITYTYDEYGRIATKQLGIYTYVYTYKTDANGNPTGQINSVQFRKNGSTAKSTTYTYDGNGNILTASDIGTPRYYAYDSANQLVFENNLRNSRILEWTYDDAGNITSRKEYARTNGAKGDLLDTVVYTYDNTEWGDLLTSYDGEPLYYDTIGNLIRDANWDYTWEQGRQLTKMKHGFYAWEFTYDSNGMRTSRTSGTTTYHYVYNGSQLVQMTVGTDILYFTYDASGAPVVVDWNGTPYYYVTSFQGDVQMIMNLAGEVVVLYVYDAWGNIVATDGELATTLGELNPLRYRSYVYDSETGLYYLQSRYYNPEWGRFINADGYTSTGQGTLGNNMFAYCGNNPVSRADDGGEWWHIAAGAIIGGLTSLGATLLTGGTFGEACVSAFFGATSGALTAALPSAGFVIDVVLGLAEEIAINAMKPEDDSEIDTAEDNTMIDTVVSVGVDSISSLTSEESRLTKEVMQEFVDAIPRISKGNHPKVKSSAQKVINRTSKLIGQELGETISEKTVSSVLKKILQAIF